jgi:hypothetical protein
MKRTPIDSVVNTTISLAVINLMVLGQALPAMADTYSSNTPGNSPSNNPNGGNSASINTNQQQQLQGRVTYAPVGTNLDSTLLSPIDSALAKPGDLFSAKLNSPLYLGSDLVLPGGTSLEGQVASADKAGLAGTNGKMTLRLIGAITPDGIRYPLSATVTADQDKSLHEDKQGNLKGRTTSSSVKSGIIRVGLWTAGGTLLGICFAPIVGGAVGAGALVGVATGGTVGVASNLWRKGKDVRIPSGTRIQFALDQPMSLTAMASSGAPTYR